MYCLECGVDDRNKKRQNIKNTNWNTNSKPEMLWVVQDFTSNQNTGCGRLLPWAGVNGFLDFANRKSAMNLSFYMCFWFAMFFLVLL